MIFLHLLVRLLQLPDHEEIFHRDLATVRGVRSVEGVWRYTLRIFLMFLLVTCIAMVIAYLAVRDVYPVDEILVVGFFTLLAIVALTYYTEFIIDIASLGFSIGLVNREVIANRLDLLRLAVGDESSVVRAKHGVAVVRTWRLAVVWIVMRIMVLLILLIFACLFLYIVWMTEVPVLSAWQPALGWAIVGIFVLPFVLIEPVWRLRLLSALGVAISARVHSRTSSVLAAIAAWFGYGIARSTLTSTLYVPVFLVGNLIYDLIAGDGEDFSRVEQAQNVLFLIYIPLVTVVALVGIYWFYRVSREFLLRNTATYLVRQ